MKKFTLSLLIFSSDKMAQEIAENLRAVRKDWNWKINIVSDPQSALEKYKVLKPALVFLSDRLPETTPAAFSRELMKISTEASLFCFNESEIEESHEFESIRWPVVSWELCADRVLSGLSKELQEKLGGRKNLSPLRSRLMEYSKQYQNLSPAAVELKKRVWIPVHRENNQDGEKKKLNRENSITKSDHLGSTSIQLEIQVPSKVEWYVLGGSLIIGTVFWFYQPEEEMILLSGLRLVSGSVAVVSFLGFFLSRAFFKLKK